MKAGCNLKLRMPHNNLKREQFFAAPFFSDNWTILLFLLLYFILNILFLGRFPVVHSDESWLAGLTLEIMKTGNPAVTEPFFTLFPRHPHAVKLLYHLAQIPFILIGGYNHISVRVLSLALGGLTLFFFYRMIRPRFGSIISLAGAALLALNIQFIYSSHMARQEAVILFFMTVAFHFGTRQGKKAVILQGLCVALAIGFHPNSFIIFIPNLLLLIYRVLRRELDSRMIVYFMAPIVLGAVFFVSLSFIFDPQFVSHYLSYGSSVGITTDVTGRIGGLFRFYGKLFFRVSGTYYVPGQKLLWIIYACIVLWAVLRLALSRREGPPFLVESLIALLGLNIGYLAVGKYSQPSVVFLLPFLILAFLSLARDLGRRPGIFLSTALGILFTVNTVMNVTPYMASDYRGYLNNIEAALPEYGAVLVNLNAGYLFEDREFYDYRNLSFLEDKGCDFADFIGENNITALVVPEELEFIYDNRPRWNIIYGNIVPWYRQMMEFLETRCVLESEFTDPFYGMRITPYIGGRPWRVRVYRVRDQEIDIIS